MPSLGYTREASTLTRHDGRAAVIIGENLSRIPSAVSEICSRLRRAGWKAWIVGGCTRDLLLGRPVHDWDVATDARPRDVTKLFSHVIPTGVQHGTVTVMLDRVGYEVTTLRGDGVYSDGRHPDSITFVMDLDADLARRDFTVNAIALDPESGVITDPLGGCRDIENRVLRAVGEPARRFSEDGLRLMRAARFCATLGFEIEGDTKVAMAETVEALRNVSSERVRDEILKSMAAPAPSRAFQVMLETSLLGAVLPELLPAVGCHQNRHHEFDVWAHTMKVVDACRPDPILRVAALLHDVGKPATRALSDKTGDYTFYQHEITGAAMTDRIANRLRLSNDDRERVVHWVRHHLVVYDETWTDAAVRRWLARVGTEHVEPVLEIARADAYGKGADPSEPLHRIDLLRARIELLSAQQIALSLRDLAVNGLDLMQVHGLAPGPIVGRTLEHLLDLVIDDPELNVRDKLLSRAGLFLRELRET